MILTPLDAKVIGEVLAGMYSRGNVKAIDIVREMRDYFDAMLQHPEMFGLVENPPTQKVHEFSAVWRQQP
jgi:hypothetical protein